MIDIKKEIEDFFIKKENKFEPWKYDILFWENIINTESNIKIKNIWQLINKIRKLLNTENINKCNIEKEDKNYYFNFTFNNKQIFFVDFKVAD